MIQKYSTTKSRWLFSQKAVLEKKPPDVFYEKRVLKSFAGIVNFTVFKNAYFEDHLRMASSDLRCLTGFWTRLWQFSPKLQISGTFNYKPSNLPMTVYQTFHEEHQVVSSLCRLWKKVGQYVQSFLKAKLHLWKKTLLNGNFKIIDLRQINFCFSIMN